MTQNTTAPATNSVKLYSIFEVQENLSISRPTINRLINAGNIKTVRIGRAIRISETELLSFIDRGGEKQIAGIGGIK